MAVLIMQQDQWYYRWS